MVFVLLSSSVKRVSVSCICIQDILSWIWTKTLTIALFIFLNLYLHQVFNKLWSPVLTQYYRRTLHTSYIRKESTVLILVLLWLLLLLLCMSRSGDLPLILKWPGLEKSGPRLISSIGKKNSVKIHSFFLDFSRFFSQDQAGLESSGQIAYT